MDWMLLPFRRYAEFSGRSRRMEFWMFFLFNVIVYAVLAVIAFGALGAQVELDPNNPMSVYAGLFSGAGLIILLYALVALVPSIAVSIRRLHDRDMSGWWYLGFVVASFIPIVGMFASIAYLVLMALPGTPGPNRFGPDPKGQGEAETFA